MEALQIHQLNRLTWKPRQIAEVYFTNCGGKISNNTVKRILKDKGYRKCRTNKQLITRKSPYLAEQLKSLRIGIYLFFEAWRSYLKYRYREKRTIGWFRSTRDSLELRRQTTFAIMTIIIYQEEKLFFMGYMTWRTTRDM